MAASIKEALEAEQSGVLTGTHTPPAESAGAAAPDLFEPGKAVTIEGRPAGSRAGRPNRLNRIMAAKIENEHGTSVLQEIVRLGMAKPADLAREMLDAAREIAAITRQPLKEVRGTITVHGLLRFKADMLATAAPYLHAKRAPEDGKGRAQPVVIAFTGLTADDLRRPDSALTDDNMVIDMTAAAFGQVEQDQVVSDPRSLDVDGTGAASLEDANNNKEIDQ